MISSCINFTRQNKSFCGIHFCNYSPYLLCTCFSWQCPFSEPCNEVEDIFSQIFSWITECWTTLHQTSRKQSSSKLHVRLCWFVSTLRVSSFGCLTVFWSHCSHSQKASNVYLKKNVEIFLNKHQKQLCQSIKNISPGKNLYPEDPAGKRRHAWWTDFLHFIVTAFFFLFFLQHYYDFQWAFLVSTHYTLHLMVIACSHF